jgi:two-component system chemotaxis response regulator CheY
MRILIAEDDPVSRLVTEAAITRLGHFAVTAVDGEAAWSRFEGGDFDAIICDRSMPVLNGDDLCRRVRAHETDRYPYFIFLTSRAEQGSIAEGMAAGADDYLVKPLDLDQLGSRLVVAQRIADLHRRIVEQQQELELLNRQLFDQSRVDALTGAGSRRKLDEDVEVVLERAVRHAELYCALMCDVDSFKQFNDTYGHGAGDEALRLVAAAIIKQCRAGDTLYRYGGEEFAIIMRIAEREEASLAAERFRAAVEALAIPHSGSPYGIITISMGCADLTDGDADAAAWLARADAALYEAKRGGRNRVASAPSPGARRGNKKLMRVTAH